MEVMFGFIQAHDQNLMPSHIMADALRQSMLPHHSQWLHLPPDGVVTRAYLQTVPQTDRISKQRAWHILQRLLLPRDRDLTDGSKFLWWLWIANLAQHQAEVVGSGIQKAELVAVNARSAVIDFTRVDLSLVQVHLTESRAGLTVQLYCRVGNRVTPLHYPRITR